ncbi:MAG: hypothetical protein LQ344_005378 [Seirophora lacunosa]|nr:MAG: hypothetical protein LQ344_005378 [Seirophora lacunosa]
MRTQPSAIDAAPLPFHPAKSADPIYDSFYHNSTAPRISTNTVLASALRKHYPDLHLTITSTYSSDLLGFAAAGHAFVTPCSTPDEPPSHHEPLSPTAIPSDLRWRRYIPPAKRDSSSSGYLVDSVKFGRFTYTWSSHTYILYNVVGGHASFDEEVSYLLSSSAQASDDLILAACAFWNHPHDEILVFDRGYWQKSHKLWESVQSSTWDDVILDPQMKASIIGEVNKFFGSQERYKKLKVPWKRGIIYYGPPGNGKTISIKAMMHTLSLPPSPIPTLYVRSLTSIAGPEYAISSIFAQARQQSPCLLVFEDLDSLVTDRVRSYFLNEVDGLESNDGILMVGSTNHLERLDKGIRNRPSRFDRKYLFPEPGMPEREAYCAFWRRKLLGDRDDDDEGGGEGEVEFPAVLCRAIAGITGGFSFAYIQEAFVASLLAIAEEKDDNGGGTKESDALDPSYEWEGRWSEVGGASRWIRDEDRDLDRFPLWRQMKKQVRILREELDDGEEEV